MESKPENSFDPYDNYSDESFAFFEELKKEDSSIFNREYKKTSIRIETPFLNFFYKLENRTKHIVQEAARPISEFQQRTRSIAKQLAQPMLDFERITRNVAMSFEEAARPISEFQQRTRSIAKQLAQPMLDFERITRNATMSFVQPIVDIQQMANRATEEAIRPMSEFQQRTSNIAKQLTQPILDFERITRNATMSFVQPIVELQQRTDKVVEEVVKTVSNIQENQNFIFEGEKMNKQIEKEDIEQEIKDWISRLNNLFGQVSVWAKENGFEVIGGSMLQNREYLMRELGIEPREVPTLELTKDSKFIKFIPNCIWIAGAKGRVNISTNKLSYSLVDKRINDKDKSNWHIVSNDITKETVPFDKKEFERIQNKR